MAPRKRVEADGQQGALLVEDCRHPDATRPNNPPVAITAEGRSHRPRREPAAGSVSEPWRQPLFATPA